MTSLLGGCLEAQANAPIVQSPTPMPGNQRIANTVVMKLEEHMCPSQRNRKYKNTQQNVF